MFSMPDLLLGENLSWRVARGLRAQGYSVVTTTEAHLTGLRDDDFRSRFGPPHVGIIIVHAPSSARNADILACLLAALPLALTQQLADSVRVIDC